MADDFPDVLDHLGKTPRELGAVHLHVEPIARANDGSAVATVWCQAAFAPLEAAPAVLEVMDSRCELPKLDGGVVMRGQVPMQIPSGTQKLLFVVKSALHKKAERVRPAWKLFDTWEQPREERISGDLDGLGNIALMNVVSLPLGVMVIPTGLATDATLRTPGKVHKAQELPPGFLAEVIAGEPAEVRETVWTEVWRPGQPLPQAAAQVWGAPPVVAPTLQTGRRRCSSCDFSGRREDFAGDKYCPSCGYEWDK